MQEKMPECLVYYPTAVVYNIDMCQSYVSILKKFEYKRKSFT